MASGSKPPTCPAPSGSSPDTQMGEHLRRQLQEGKRSGRYWSITTMPQPFAAWSPLPSHQEKETRPCHCSISRVHKLRCGHLVAVAREAEQCAQNCVGSSAMMPDLIRLHTSTPSPSSEAEGYSEPRSSPNEIYENNVLALRQYAVTFLGVREDIPLDDQLQAVARANAHLAILNRVNFKHQLNDRLDLVGGDFGCQECRVEGHRPSVPVYHYRRDPWHVIIPIRNEEDQTLVRRLKDGTTPSRPSNKGRNHVQAGRGRGGKARSFDRLLGGRITKQRVEEKERVLGRMKEEELMESLEGMGIGSVLTENSKMEK
ncbi:uncharacterized protein EI97DRAFT_461534 [Westerdykella ornata]|uniref:SWIM-type domain-containing protein n=1 Tax=Westerdykella ornata TaxID=318751 RepID=A0A6A6J9I1_WESOR|nr:uncharacterized protein EI97DRAFT_461534 [Westerdykella ornata]KAF2272917.1 hypothetical protein EI97DRAFT_461534 [Westerdykella ornata]